MKAPRIVLKGGLVTASLSSFPQRLAAAFLLVFTGEFIGRLGEAVIENADIDITEPKK